MDELKTMELLEAQIRVSESDEQIIREDERSNIINEIHDKYNTLSEKEFRDWLANEWFKID